MISAISKPQRVTFTGERMGERVTVRTLIDALEGALVWLRGRDPDSTVDWEVVKVAIGKSLRITFSSPNVNGDISTRMRNLHQLQKRRMPKVAPRLTDEDIDGTNRLASMIGKELKSITISSPGAPKVKVTPVLIERVETIASTVRGNYYEWTTIRGYMDQITVSATLCRFRLRHELTGAELSCTIPIEELDNIKNALPHRVEVYGRVKYNRSNQPKTIDMAKITRRLPESNRPFDLLPPVDITHGMSSEDYIERLRGA